MTIGEDGEKSKYVRIQWGFFLGVKRGELFVNNNNNRRRKIEDYRTRPLGDLFHFSAQVVSGL